MTNRIKGGATIWARQTIDSDIFRVKNADWFKIWFYIVNRVNHENNKWFSRGSNFFQYREIESATSTTHGQVHKCVAYLKQSTMISTQKSTRGMIITVEKYDFYQNLDNYKSTQDSTVQSTRSAHEVHTINKNVKNDNTYTETKVSESLPSSSPHGIALQAATAEPKYDRTEDLAPDGDRKDPADDPKNIPFDFTAYMNQLKNSKKESWKILHLYWSYKKINLTTLKQARLQYGMDIKYAEGLAGFPREKIVAAFKAAKEDSEKDLYDWKLSTVFKKITTLHD